MTCEVRVVGVVEKRIQGRDDSFCEEAVED